MTLTLDLNPAQEREIETLAESEGISVNEYALRRLLPLSLASKPYRAMQFSGVAPTNRTAEEVDADIAAMRKEWDDRESAWRSTPARPIATP